MNTNTTGSAPVNKRQRVFTLKRFGALCAIIGRYTPTASTDSVWASDRVVRVASKAKRLQLRLESGEVPVKELVRQLEKLNDRTPGLKWDCDDDGLLMVEDGLDSQLVLSRV